MGWFLINILLPVGVPLAFLLAAKLVDLPEPYASRARLIKAVQDGQLGWVATVFAAASIYELLQQLQDRKEAPIWISFAFALSCGLLAISGFLAILGTLYPLKESKFKARSFRERARHFRLFLTTLLATIVAAGLFALAHYTLPLSCSSS